KNAGVSRISINPQTLNNDILKEIGRNHTREQTIESFKLAREVGFDNINMDIIAGLPKDTIGSFKRTVDEIISLSPENVTVHTLTIKRCADYAEDKKEVLKHIGEVSQMVDYAQDSLMNNEFLPYYLYRQKNTIGNLENVGYCKKGFEGYYNVYIMDETHTILATGAGAVTKLKQPNGTKIERVFNYKFPFEYINDFQEILKRKDKVKGFYGQFGI
ncbi:MAG: radical SAM protein, partial [Oscillospiraceae bacterium]